MASDTAIGRTMRDWLFQRPATRVARITAGHILLLTILGAGIALALWFGGRDGASMPGMGAPEVITSLGVLEVDTYLDVVVAVVATASLVRLRGVGTLLAAWWGRAKTRTRHSRARRTRGARRPPANDDERSWLRLAA